MLSKTIQHKKLSTVQYNKVKYNTEKYISSQQSKVKYNKAQKKTI